MDFDKVIEQFERDGYAVVEGFVPDDEVEAMKAECSGLIDAMNPAEHHTVFSTTKQSYRDDYFINSSDKIGFFFEEKALDKEGNLVVDKHKSLNKVGHALHVLCPSFRKVTFSQKIKELIRALEMKDPVVVQSMYIFKQPGIGGEVVPHQDATYLSVEPLKECGIWIALEDATLDNGCLWFQPGSQRRGLLGNYRMIRNPEKEGPSCVYTGEKPAYDDQEYVPVPVKKGDMVLIDGLVVHKSEPNTSQNSRHIYTFHVFDQGTGVWSEKNWLQPTAANTFSHMNEVQV